MLDIIFASRSADLGWAGSFGSFMTTIVSTVNKKGGDFASMIEKGQTKIQGDIDKTIRQFEDLE